MSHTNLCRLCLNLCKNCKKLYCESGQSNEIYEITVKYFHPMYLNVDQDNYNTVICLECWHHISDFHSYQQSVIQAQQTLLKEESPMEFQAIQSKDSNEIANCVQSIKKEEDSMSLPDLELMEEFTYEQNNENVDTSNKTAYNSPEDSDNVGNRNCGLYNDEAIQNEAVNVRTAVDEDIQAPPSITLESGNNSTPLPDGNQSINTRAMKRKRESRKSQKDIDTFISTWRENLKCRICEALFTTFAYLQQHFHEQHPTEQCYITCCSRNFKTLARIEEHARFHTDPDAFKCLICRAKLSSASSLSTHSRKCRETQTATTLYTKAPIEAIDNFIAMYKPNLDCEICHESCTSLSLLKIHFRYKHPNEAFHIMCCKRKFINRSAFKDHVWLHLDPNAFKCNICDNHQSGYNSLQVHMEAVHRTTLKIKSLADIVAEIQSHGNKPLNDYITLQHSILLGSKTQNSVTHGINLNISAHLNPNRSAETKNPRNIFDEFISSWKPILECVLCGEYCRTYTELEQHFRMKHPQTNCYFQCCQQQLNSRLEIEEHIRGHQTRKENVTANVYQCHMCSKCYQSPQMLREHLSFQHHNFV